ncbi:hypothetical protein O181_017463 [Austropuccinia psidii MF-1]|uniref:Uncharacterized protein n=1 Tax=Austropuccinia psidii MF-1 TaxID=1389203 RepID=A0A9Q3C761_9BASI|nr:hypothetical protein [Austropuccinia psidii MF-1]
MVHTRSGSNYSVQPDGSGKGRGKTRIRPGRPSSRKKHLEVARVCPSSPRSVTTTFYINSEPELYQGDFLRVEPLPSGINRNMSVPVQKLAQRSQGRGMVNLSKPLAGVHEHLLTNQELSKSEEDHRTIRRMDSLVLKRQSKKYK